MKRIVNPFHSHKKEDYNCFGCSPNNKRGLHLEFFDDGDQIISKWDPQKYLEGYHDIVHGGIQTLLMDEIGAWLVYVKCETAGVTSSLHVDFIKPLRMSKGEVTIKAELIEQKEKSAIISASIYDFDNVLCAKAKLDYFIYPQAIAVRRLGYPGVDAFYE